MSRIVSSAEDFSRCIADTGSIVGLDLGTKTIGMAVCDAARTIATPRGTIRRRKFTADAELVLALVRDAGAVGIVLGLPINMDATEGRRAQSTRAFARNLAHLTDVPILLWDERMSTVAVERTLLDADMSRGKRARVIDKMAAAWILQGVLDRLRTLRSAP